MAYQAENGIWSSVFAVPSEVVDKHIKLCGPLSLRVLLLLLRHGGRMETDELARMLNQPAPDIQDAMNYWVQTGVIRQDGAPVSDPAPGEAPLSAHQPAALVAYEQIPPARSTAAAPPASAPSPAPGGERITTLTRTRQRYTTAEINDMARSDNIIPHLLDEAQSCLGKPLTPAVTDLVVALYSDYGMQPDLVLMLLHYCTSIGKGNTKYVEKVAASWLENGIDSHEKAEQEILRRTRQDQSEEKVRRVFGIHDRSLVSSEKKYINTWIEEYHMELSLIELAYERTVELKGKLSFPYINGILSNWYAKGIATPAQATQEITQGRPQKGGPEAGGQGQASYDLGKLEQMINSGKIL